MIFCLLFVLRNVDFLYCEISSGKHVFFEASAAGAIALMFNNIKNLIAVLTYCHTGDYIHDELCALKNGTLDDDVVNVLNILGDYQRKLADVKDDFFDLRNVIFFCEVFDCVDYLSYDSYFMHGDYFLEIFLTAIRPIALGALETAVSRVLW